MFYTSLLRYSVSVAINIFALTCAVALQAEPLRGLDPDNIDRSVDACQNFYQYACGRWLKQNPLSDATFESSRYERAIAANQQKIFGLLLEEIPSRHRSASPLSTYLIACLDRENINRLGARALLPELSKIAAVHSRADLPAVLAHLHAIGVPAFFSFSSQQDLLNSSVVEGVFDQENLGLPDRDYYFSSSPRYSVVSKNYLLYLQKILRLVGESAGQARQQATAIFAIETALAQESLSSEQQQNLIQYHPYSIEALKFLAAGFDWQDYLKILKVPTTAKVNLRVPFYIAAVSRILSTYNLEDIKAYLRWRLVDRSIGLLSDQFQDLSWDFYGKQLLGIKNGSISHLRLCTRLTQKDLNSNLSQLYVKKLLNKQDKFQVARMVKSLQQQLERSIGEQSWMTAETRKEALSKMSAISIKIGYPDHWNKYPNLTFHRQTALDNHYRAQAAIFTERIRQIGKKADRGIWLEDPTSVDAYFEEYNNAVILPAGILQSPFYSSKVDKAVNYGIIGLVIGHELTHLFDNRGRRFDELGNLRDWWSTADAKAFEQQATCFVDQYSRYKVAPDLNLNGKLTLNENIADNGGARLAYRTLMADLSTEESQKRVDGFTPGQRYFIAFAQQWCGSENAESLRLKTLSEEHSPSEFRVNGVVSNMPEFAEVFGCKPGTAMVRDNACHLW